MPFNRVDYTQSDDRETYLRKAIEQLRQRITHVIADGQNIDKELTSIIEDAIKIKRHFRRVQREYSRLEDDLTAIEKESWEIEDATGITQKQIAGDVIDKMTEPTSLLDDILTEHSPQIKPEKKTVSTDTMLDDLFEL